MSTAPVTVKRKLAAILAADAVGYSRLMAADDEATLKLLAAHRAVIDGIIEFHEGRIVNTAGDSVLAEFASPVQAVRCAVEIQDALRTRNDSLPEDRRLQFRIGVNLGDVMTRGDDLLGDGVNVAARLESVADPGGICISASVYDQISGKLDLGFVDVGTKALKNIDRPVRVYRVERDCRSRTETAGRRAGPRRWLMGLAVVALLGFGTWHFVIEPQREEVQRAAAEAARKQAEAEAAKRQSEVEKQRAAANAARMLAEARAAEAAEAKRALEARRSAEARASAEAEVARLRAEAEVARLRAEAEKARSVAVASPPPAATTTPAPAEARTSALSLREGQWMAQILCPPFQNFPARTIVTPVSASADMISIQDGTPGEPQSLTLRGVVNSDGTVLFRGSGVSGRRVGANPYKSGFAVRPVGQRYEGSGRLGPRECQLILEPAQ